LGKKDELWETDSGLTVLNAISELETKAFDLFENGFMKLKLRSQGRITLKTATALANELAVGMIAPIMSQIDPLHVGEVSRAMKIGRDYGDRLSKVSKNLKPRALSALVNDYSSHGFVIDKKEAEELFEKVRSEDKEESALIELLGAAVKAANQNEPILFAVSDEKAEVKDDSNHAQDIGTPATEAGAVAGSTEGSSEIANTGAKATVAEIRPVAA